MKYVAYLVTALVGIAVVIEAIRQISRQELAENFTGLHDSAHMLEEARKLNSEIKRAA